MNKKWLSLIILFICLSLAGIIVVQYMWISNALKIRQAQFDQSVNEALTNVVRKLETCENMALIQSRLITDSIVQIIQCYAKDSADLTQTKIDLDQVQVALSGKNHPGNPPDQEVPFRTLNNRLREARYHQIETWSKEQQQMIDSIMNRIQPHVILTGEIMSLQFEWQNRELNRLDSIWLLQEQMVRRKIPGEPMPPVGRNIRIVTHAPLPLPGKEETAARLLEEKVKKLNKRADQLQELIQRMAIEFEQLPKTVESRIDKQELHKTLVSSLSDKDILLPFEYAVYSPLNDSNPIPLRSDHFQDIPQEAGYKVSLFPNDVIEKPEQLLVYFPGQKNHLLKSLSFLMFGSLFFTLIVVLSSGLSIFVILRQKKISDIKTDFINNMTHEFKTPLATISIAADSINNPKVLDAPDKIKSFTKIIKEENSRMNSRVEQVLQMSLLDSRDFKLQPEVLDLQELIRQSVVHFQLIVERHGGQVQTSYEANDPWVEVDEGHMRNVLMNLLDNAQKYSLSHPDILVYTGNRPGLFYFGVSDKGMGMSTDVQKRAFDKFFRVTTGNIHHIKGFGLGLSYVKAIVLAHKGGLKLTSELGKGSRFEISLPVAQEAGPKG